MGRPGEAAPQPRLGPVLRALELLGRPDRTAPIVHITGTNGKTSTSRMIASVLEAHGLRTGTFTSPHLVSLNERIRVNGQDLSDEALICAWRATSRVIDRVDGELAADGGPPMTFFEVLVVVAFCAFAGARVEALVIEVGLGGTWDATNAADATIAVFTPIDLDHTAVLGPTVQDIARTKAGIIKQGSTVVTAAQAPSAMIEICAAASMARAEVVREGEHVSVRRREVRPDGQYLNLRLASGREVSVRVPLGAPYQAQNSVIALAAVEQLFDGQRFDGRQLDDTAIARGFASATSPGRLQIVRGGPTVVVDAAHNPHGVAATMTAMSEMFVERLPVVVVGVLDDKNAGAMISGIVPGAARIVVTRAPSPRALADAELFDLVLPLAGDVPVQLVSEAGEAISTARDLAGDEGVVLVIGSVTLAGLALEILKALPH
jgi:dihydrofolate synthase/folylpolyglutamate synthase